MSPKVEAAPRSHRTVVHFAVGKAKLDTISSSNRTALDLLRSFIAKVAGDSTLAVTAIRFEGYASPEGPNGLNTRLSAERRKALETYVRSFYNAPDSLCSSSTEVYDSIHAAAYAEASPAERRRMIQRFKALRFAAVTIDYARREVPAAPVAEVEDIIIEPDTVAVIETEQADTVTIAATEEAVPPLEPVEAEHPCSPLYIGLKTNMLYDALLIPTLGADFYVGRNLSVSGQWGYAWWSRDRSHRYWRYYGGDLGLRWWFGRQARTKPLRGHHLGIYAQIFTYDFETGGKGEMGAKFNYGGGIEYGFSLPVARRLNIDFSIGAGYIAGRYYKYKPIDGHYVWQSTHNRHWFGPTKAEVSLVWLIGCGNYNAKGGAR